MKRFVFILMIVTVMVLPVHFAHAASSGINITPEVPIPGVYSGPQTIDNNGIATYIRAIFVYFIWVVGILATVMVIFGGIRWVAAAGNTARIRDARETVNNAVIGLIIALTSYTLLYVINPDLLNLKLPDVTPVNKQALTIQNGCAEDLTCQKVLGSAYQQVQGLRCDHLLSTAASLVDPGSNFCGDSTHATGQICCQNTQLTTDCVALSGSDGSQAGAGKCDLTVQKTPASSSAGCSDQTPCGQLLNGCIGTFCPSGQACADRNGPSGSNAGCIDPSLGSNSVVSRVWSVDNICTLPNNQKGFLEYYTTAKPCGQTLTYYDPTTKQQVTAFGTNGGCKSGTYCKVASIENTGGACLLVSPRTYCAPLGLPPAI